MLKGDKMQSREIGKNERISYKDKVVIYSMTQIDTDNLLKIWVLTTDQGPFFDDVVLALIFDDLTIIIPSEHPDHQLRLFRRRSYNVKS